MDPYSEEGKLAAEAARALELSDAGLQFEILTPSGDPRVQKLQGQMSGLYNRLLDMVCFVVGGCYE